MDPPPKIPESARASKNDEERCDPLPCYACGFQNWRIMANYILITDWCATSYTLEFPDHFWGVKDRVPPDCILHLIHYHAILVASSSLSWLPSTCHSRPSGHMPLPTNLLLRPHATPGHMYATFTTCPLSSLILYTQSLAKCSKMRGPYSQFGRGGGLGVNWPPCTPCACLCVHIAVYAYVVGLGKLCSKKDLLYYAPMLKKSCSYATSLVSICYHVM